MIDGSISLENFYSAFPQPKKIMDRRVTFESWNSCLDWIWQICCSFEGGNSQKKMSTEAGGKASFLAWLPQPPWTIIMRNSTLAPRLLTFIRLLLVIARRKWLLVFLSPKVVLYHCSCMISQRVNSAPAARHCPKIVSFRKRSVWWWWGKNVRMLPVKTLLCSTRFISPIKQWSNYQQNRKLD